MHDTRKSFAHRLTLGMLALGLFTWPALPTWSAPPPQRAEQGRVLATSVPGGQLELEQVPDPTNASVKQTAWYFHPRNGKRKRLGDFPAAMNAIADLSASPDGRFVAVISVGEGHPVLEVSPLQDLLRGRGLVPRVTVNPYPQAINLKGWERGRLRVASAMLLTRAGRDGHVPAILDLEDEQLFLLDPAARAFTAVSARARKPEAWFQGRLKSPKPAEVAAAASALTTLRATSALPELRRALARATDPDCQKALQQAITALGHGSASPTPHR